MYKIDRPNLIESDKDHFNLYPKVEGINNFLENIHQKEIVKHNNLIALYGEWGSGKSSIVTTVNEKLDKAKFNPFIFEAWKYEKDDNLPFSIFEAIMDNIIGDKEAIKEILKEGFFEGLKSFANGITIKTQFVDASLKDMKPSERKESLYTKIENFIDKFKELLDKFSKGKTTVVFIDDLDRCEDESIINLLVALKLMFTLENVIFVCCIDKVATIEALKRKYNDNQEKSENFLDKLFLFDFNIIPIKSYNFIDISDEYEPQILLKVFEKFDIKNPRKMKKIINKIIMLDEFINSLLFKENEKKLYFTTLYYLMMLKEVDFLLFNKFLSLEYGTMDLEKTYEYIMDEPIEKYSIKSFPFKSTPLKKYVEILKEIIDLFNLVFSKGELISSEKLSKGIPIQMAVELLKKYS